MICLRCGYCCKSMTVVIVDDPKRRIVEDNLIFHDGGGIPCKHLKGDKIGKYSCKIHNEKWYKKTPCFSHGQIESDVNQNCRMGEYLLKERRGFE